MPAPVYAPDRDGLTPTRSLHIPEDDLFHYLTTCKWNEKGNKVGLICEDGTSRQIMYRDLQSRLLAAATALTTLGFERGEVLSVHLHNCVEFMIAVLSAVALGSVASPSNPAYEASDLSHQLNDSGGVILITSSKYEEIINKVQKPKMRQMYFIEDQTCFVHATNVVPGGVPALPTCGVRPDPYSLMVLPYSSGTTGKAKGVQLTHMNIVANIVQANATHDNDVVDEIRWDIKEDDTLPTVLPLFHSEGRVTRTNAAMPARTTLILPETRTACARCAEHRFVSRVAQSTASRCSSLARSRWVRPSSSCPSSSRWNSFGSQRSTRSRVAAWCRPSST